MNLTNPQINLVRFLLKYNIKLESLVNVHNFRQGHMAIYLFSLLETKLNSLRANKVEHI